MDISISLSPHLEVWISMKFSEQIVKGRALLNVKILPRCEIILSCKYTKPFRIWYMMYFASPSHKRLLVSE